MKAIMMTHRHHHHHHHLVDGNISKPGTKVSIGSIAAKVEQLLPGDHSFQLIMMMMMMTIEVMTIMMMMMLMVVVLVVTMPMCSVCTCNTLKGFPPLKAPRHRHKGR